MTRKGQNLLELLVRRETKTAAVEAARPVRSCTLSDLFIKRAQVTPPQPKTPTLPEPSMAPAKMVTPKLRNADYGYNHRGYAGVDDPAGYTGPVKTGPLLARDEQNPFQAGVDRMLKEEARGPAPLTNQDYAKRFKRESDALTDAQRQAQEQAHWKKQPIVQRKSDLAIIQGNRGMKTWGDRLDSVLGKGDPNAGVRTMRPVQGPKWWQTASQWADAGVNMAKDVFSRETLHDIANNAQMQYESALHGAGQVGRFLGKWVDPRSWGSSWSSRQNRLSHDNRMSNESRSYADRMARIVGNSQTGLDDLQNSALAKLNAGGNMAVGQFAGGELATAGIGTGLKAGGKAVQYGGRLTGRAVGNLAGRAVNSQRVARVGELAGDYFGEALGSPLSYAGRAMTGSSKIVGRGAYEPATSRAAGRLDRVVGAVSTPAQTLRSAGQTIRHPFSSGLGSTAGRGLDAAWRIQNASQIAGGALDGNPAEMGRSAGEMAWYNAMGRLGGRLGFAGQMLPVAYDVARGFGDDDNPEDAE